LRNIKLVVEYDGTDYHGFAIQRRLRTVQGELERSIEAVVGAKTRIVGSGRTDAGAHAMGQVVSFRAETRLTPLELRRALNANLPDDIVVKEVQDVPEGFHARRSALRRHYRYSIWNAELPSVWIRRYRYHVVEQLDVEAMNQAAGFLVGTHDFACFTKGLGQYLASGSRRTTVRTIFKAAWTGNAPWVDFDVVGTAFLPHMIRNIVGCMLKIGTGKAAPEGFGKMLENGETPPYIWTVPAHGLMLVAVEY